MIAKRFNKDGQLAWTNADATVHSGAIETSNVSLDLATGFARDEKAIVWIKTPSAELTTKVIEETVGKINKGLLMTYREFSETPMHDQHLPDVNPTTNEQLVPTRYSQVKLCVASKYDELNRQYVVPTQVAVVGPAPIEVNP